MSKIDLHIHSNNSLDGEISVEEILKRSNERNIEVISITDHNTVKGVKEAIKLSESMDIKVISGIEIDCTFKGINLHVLGYGIDYENKVYQELEDKMTEVELDYVPKAIKKIEDLGYHVDRNILRELSDSDIVAPELIAECILKDPKHLNNEVLKKYRDGGSRGDMPYLNFYRDYFASGKLAYVKKEYMSLEDAIKLVKQSGGKAILAHPGESLKDGRIVDEIIKLGIDGLEVFSSYHDEETTNFYYEVAQKHNLIYTCGSDFHGKNKPTIEMGSINCRDNEELIWKKLL